MLLGIKFIARLFVYLASALCALIVVVGLYAIATDPPPMPPGNDPYIAVGRWVGRVLGLALFAGLAWGLLKLGRLEWWKR